MSDHLGEVALNNAVASYYKNRELFLRRLAKEARAKREAEQACASASGKQ